MWDAAWMSTILGNLRFPDDITLTGVDRSGEYGMEISTQKTSLMFATRDLPTCNILIRKDAYICMKSVAESRNVILHSIVRSDSLFTSPLWQHWRNLLYVHPF